MSKRRMNGEGAIAQRPGGTWQGRLSYIDPVTGLRKRVSVDGPTAAAVRAKMKETRERLESGAPPKDAKQTVADWLKHWKKTTLAVSDRAGSTKENYGNVSAAYLEPEPFGEITLDKLRPSDIEAWILAMRAKTKPAKVEGADPVRAYAESTIRTTFIVLRAALDGAVRDGLLARNPAAVVKCPTVPKKEAKYLPAGDVTALLEAMKDSRFFPVIVLIASTGMCRGEACALAWDSVNLDAGTLRVNATLNRLKEGLVFGPPKTERRRREVPLDPAVVTMLRKHRTAQKEEKMKARNQWTETGWSSPPSTEPRWSRATS
jgi:integrase